MPQGQKWLPKPALCLGDGAGLSLVRTVHPGGKMAWGVQGRDPQGRGKGQWKRSKAHQRPVSLLHTLAKLCCSGKCPACTPHPHAPLPPCSGRAQLPLYRGHFPGQRDFRRRGPWLLAEHSGSGKFSGSASAAQESMAISLSTHCQGQSSGPEVRGAGIMQGPAATPACLQARCREKQREKPRQRRCNAQSLVLRGRHNPDARLEKG